MAYGSKANDKITVADGVTVPATLDGGRGGKNVLTGGGGYTLSTVGSAARRWWRGAVTTS